MSNKLKIFLGISYLIVLTFFLYFVFSYLEINRLGDFSYYKELQISIENYITDNVIINLIYFAIFTIIWISLLGFGSPITIASGILFGKWLGTLVSLISVCFGALILYSITDFFFKDLVKRVLDKRFGKYIQVFQKNEFFYYFIYRFIGGLGLPFFLQNTLPVIFSMKKSNYFFSSLLGLIPGFFIFNTIGAGLNTYIKKSETFSLLNLIFTQEIYIPILTFICLIIISVLIKKKFFDDRY